MVVRLRGQPVTRNENIKYLGVWIDDALNWSDRIEAIRQKCFAGLARLRRVRGTLPSVTKRNIYNALILLHLYYCCVLRQECGKALQVKVERIQNYDMRFNS